MWRIFKKHSLALMKHICSAKCIILKNPLGLTNTRICQIGKKKKTIIRNIHKEITTAVTMMWSNQQAAIRHGVAQFIRRSPSDDDLMTHTVPRAMICSCLVLILTIGAYPLFSSDGSLLESKGMASSLKSISGREAVAVNKPSLAVLRDIDQARRIAVSGFSIKANGKSIAFAGSKLEADQILTGLKKKYARSGIQEAWFVEAVVVKPERLDIVKFDGNRTVEEAIEQIASGSPNKRVHEIQQGENLWLVAQKYQVSMDALIAANPGIDPVKVKAGQSIDLMISNPLISVATKEIAEFSETIPFDVYYEDSPAIYKGEIKVRQEGIEGKQTVKAEIIRINGVVKENRIIEQNIAKNPIQKIVVKGTKTPLLKMGSGIFAKPTSQGILTSRFGSRGGGVHKGIDIGLPIGSPVKASAAGRVIFSGYKDDYGYYIIISHGENTNTLYAHNSKLLVKKGDSVSKGQEIAKSGNSGRSTGPHLHFEVVKNGNSVNPTKYVKY